MELQEILKEALEVLKKGGIILYPTDTIWGIGCDATNEEAVRKVFEIKKRADSKSLVLLASDLDMIARHVKEIPSIAIDLVEVNDRPMTIVYPQGQLLAPSTLAADGSVGIRIPMNDFCRELVKRLRHPLVSTSANVSGEPSPRCFKDIPQSIKDSMDYIVPRQMEAGSTGLASQILKVGLKGEIEIIRA